MPGAPGKDLLLQREDTPGSGTYTTLGGLKAKTFTIEHEGIEDTNHGSSEAKSFIDGAGIKSMKIQGSGVFDRSAGLNGLVDNLIAGTQTRMRVIDTGSGGRTYTALFHLQSVEMGSEYNGAQDYSIQMESSGSITIS